MILSLDVIADLLRLWYRGALIMLGYGLHVQECRVTARRLHIYRQKTIYLGCGLCGYTCVDYGLCRKATTAVSRYGESPIGMYTLVHQQSSSECLS